MDLFELVQINFEFPPYLQATRNNFCLLTVVFFSLAGGQISPPEFDDLHMLFGMGQSECQDLSFPDETSPLKRIDDACFIFLGMM